MKLLIVDDSPENIEMMQLIFKAGEYNVYTAMNGNEGIEVLRREKIQLVLVDWMMPDFNGIEFVKYVRDIITDYYVYIIMVTAKEGYEARIQGLESGVDDYINRPFRNRELKARVKIGERIIEIENALKQTTQQVEVAHHEWEATADAIAQLVCLVDRSGSIIRVNRTVEDWGLTWTDEAQGQKLSDVIGNVYTGFAEQIAGVWEIVQSRIEQDLGFEFMGNDLKLGHHFHVQIEPIEYKDNLKIRDDSFAAVSIQDITQKRKLELALEEEHKKSEQLLQNILPTPISERLKEGGMLIADEFESVSVLFTDLVGFTQFSNQVPASRLVTLLNFIFLEFDVLTEKHGLEKIKTIGDAYMAVCGLPIPHDNHAIATVNMALDIVDVMQKINTQHGTDFNIRIGVHSGPVVAGVIGLKKFAYDLWGDTVNIASRMESSGEAGKVHISAQTAALLPTGYHLHPRKSVSLKGIGDVKTYFVERAPLTTQPN